MALKLNKNRDTNKKKVEQTKKAGKHVSQTQEERNFRNRESARLCRLRKKEYVFGLEKRITELIMENDKLKTLLKLNSNK